VTNSRRNCSNTLGVSKVLKIRKSGESANAVIAIVKASIPPLSGLVILDMINMDSAPSTAGKNLTPKTE
jgi:hypothetical protein